MSKGQVGRKAAERARAERSGAIIHGNSRRFGIDGEIVARLVALAA
ncbi:hypothetical protein [Chromobacterium sphagni]|nr:hypothetical protein [Chromobacterium sphagni]